MASGFGGINGGNEFFGGRIVGVDNAVASLFEKFAFGFDVIVEGLVIIKMLMSDISHDGDFNRDAEGAELSKSVRSDF